MACLIAKEEGCSCQSRMGRCAFGVSIRPMQKESIPYWILLVADHIWRN